MCSFIIFLESRAKGKNGTGHTKKEEDGEITFPMHEEYEGITKSKAYWLFSCLGGEEKDAEDGEDAPETELTCGEFRDLLYAFCVEENLDYEQVVGQLPERLFTVQEEDAIYLSEFLSLYEELLVLCEKQQDEAGAEERKLPKYQDFYVLLLENGKLYDAKGNTYRYDRCEDYSGIFVEMTEQYPLMDPVAGKAIKEKERRTMLDYKDRMIKALCFGNQILYIKETLVQTATVPNVWVTGAKQSRLSVFLHGCLAEYETTLPLAQGFENMVCDLELENGKVAGITVKKDVIQGKVL